MDLVINIYIYIFLIHETVYRQYIFRAVVVPISYNSKASKINAFLALLYPDTKLMEEETCSVPSDVIRSSRLKADQNEDDYAVRW